jgi:hypothetical protein
LDSIVLYDVSYWKWNKKVWVKMILYKKHGNKWAVYISVTVSASDSYNRTLDSIVLYDVSYWKWKKRVRVIMRLYTMTWEQADSIYVCEC